MGILRLLLAFSVLIGHAHAGLVLVGGAYAVEMFFMISGFYMGLVLTERYTGKGSYRLFLGNRALRLFPAYWVVVLVSIAWWLLIGTHSHIYGPLDLFRSGLHLPGLLLLVVVQIVIVGYEVFYYLGLAPHGRLFWTHDFQTKQPQLWQLGMVPQAWSLSLELVFYLVAPFLVRLSSRFLVAIAVLSMGVRLFIYEGIGWKNDPWTYRFFPNEIMFFIGGVLAYRVYTTLRERRPSYAVLTTIVVAFIGFLFLFPILPGANPIAGFVPRVWTLFAITWCVLPYLFLWSNPVKGTLRKLRVSDRWIGELSYPAYITHYLAIQIVHAVGSKGRLGGNVQLVLVMAITIAMSTVLLRLVMLPVEKIRERRVAKPLTPTMEQAINVINP